MRAEHSGDGDHSTDSLQLLINQLKEITGIHDMQVLQRALNASQGDVGHAVGLLTSKPAEVHDAGEDPDSHSQAWEAQKGVPKDELEAAIELSLQESHTAQEEEREYNRSPIGPHVAENCPLFLDKRNLAFMQELRCLFALMVASTCKFVDPSAAVELLREAFRTSEAQQDISEFTHKLLDWLEDAFQLTATGTFEFNAQLGRPEKIHKKLEFPQVVYMDR
ncbi:hypothetical protein CRUP_036560 [Coryphaenoides rupestris]|nr:hypothetical protein CRUP_036560 [Coryphaenoides rupestris]